MRKSLIVFMFLVFSLSSWAQRTHTMTREGAAGDFFIGYSLLNGDTLSHGSGWEAALTGNLSDWLGLKADFGGNYKNTAGISVHEYNIQFGPQLALRSDKFHVFVHGLVGIAHAGVDGATSTGAAWTLGGGVDYDLNPSFAFRPVQLDYHGAHVFSNTQRDARYSVGLVYRFK